VFSLVDAGNLDGEVIGCDVYFFWHDVYNLCLFLVIATEYAKYETAANLYVLEALWVLCSAPVLGRWLMFSVQIFLGRNPHHEEENKSQHHKV
jgi:hypothetical protein